MRWSIEVNGSNFQQSGEHKLVTTNGPECTPLHLAAIIIFASLRSVEFFLQDNRRTFSAGQESFTVQN